VSVGAATQLLRQVREGVGFGKAGRETVIRALGYNSLNGRSNRILAALLHYGLLERSGDSAVQISALGKKLLLPTDNVESRRAIADAASRPNLFKKLIVRFQGHGLPGLLPNILVREFGVVPGSSEEVAKVFRESMTDAGLLRNGVLFESIEDAIQDSPVEDASDTSTSERQGEVAQVRPSIQDESPAAPVLARGAAQYSIPLDRNGRVAMIEIPLPVGKAELNRIKIWADFMLQIEDE